MDAIASRVTRETEALDGIAVAFRDAVYVLGIAFVDTLMKLLPAVVPLHACLARAGRIHGGGGSSIVILLVLVKRTSRQGRCVNLGMVRSCNLDNGML